MLVYLFERVSPMAHRLCFVTLGKKFLTVSQISCQNPANDGDGWNKQEAANLALIVDSCRATQVALIICFLESGEDFVPQHGQ